MLKGWLADLACELGTDAAEHLRSRHGGTEIYVPVRRSDAFVAHVGRADIASWLIDRHGGQKLYVPMGDGREEVWRARAEAFELRRSGLAHRDIARRLGRSVRWVRRALTEE